MAQECFSITPQADRSMTLHLGDSLQVLKGMDDNSIDSVVTDPPYGLKFMGKKWDHDVPSVELWREVLRVLKPGGHLLSFGGTRTYHRMVVAIEDAGFEIRDSIMWHMGSGFPKSYNIKQGALKKGVACDCETPEYDMRSVRKTDLSEAVNAEDKSGQVLQSCMSKQGASKSRAKGLKSKATKREEPSLEGRQVCGARKGLCNGQGSETPQSESQRVRFRAHFDRGADAWTFTEERGSGSPQEPQSVRQSAGKPGSIRKPQRALDETPLPRCSKCQRHIFPEGFGSALKPATEIIAVARKPLSEKNLVANVLKWGVGGLNIDGCRIGDETIKISKGKGFGDAGIYGKGINTATANTEHQGRWPANVIFDEEAAEVLDEQVGKLKGGGPSSGRGFQDAYVGGKVKTDIPIQKIDKGGFPSRFFYCAKASKSERNAGLDCYERVSVEHNLCKDALTVVVQLLQKVTSEDIAQSKTELSWNIGESGKSITAIFPRECKSTTKTMISKIIESRILRLLTRSLTRDSTQDASLSMVKGGSPAASVESLKKWLLNITKEEMELALGVASAASKTLLSISESAEQESSLTNFHSTVKPIKLMRYLCRLITPPGGTVLDPFMGSGTTGVAAKQLGREFIGIELNPEYLEIAKGRIGVER